MVNKRPTHSGMRVAVVVSAIALLAGVPFSDSPDFFLDTTLESVDLAFSESRDFALDARLTAYDPDYGESNSFALDSTGINRAWGDSETFTMDTSGVPVTPDCNHNGKIDSRDIAYRTSFDCNKNSVPDECDIRDGASRDCVVVNGIPDECEGFGHWCPSDEDDQLQDGQNTNFEKVTLDHLWEWSPVDGRFVDPGDAGVTIDPTKPTYLLTHGWDGELDGNRCGSLPDRNGDTKKTCADLGGPLDDPEFAMSSVGAAIRRAKGDTVNLLAWDWADVANPNGCCDITAIRNAPTQTVDAFASLLEHPTVPTIKQIIAHVLDAALCLTVDVDPLAWALDAYISGSRVKDEGKKLGQALANILGEPNGSLGSELHFIGKSHGGGVLGAAARILKEKGVRVDSLSTLDTPKVVCIPGTDLCYIDSLQYVDPTAADHTAVFYYPERAVGGFGGPLRVTGNVTNLSLNSGLGSGLRHLWIAGNDDCECPPPWSANTCFPDEGWFPVNVWNNAGVPPGPETLTFEQDNDLLTTVLDVEHFPHGIWVEHTPQNEFAPTGACCIPLIIPIGGNRCEQVSESQCSPNSVFLGNNTVCLGDGNGDRSDDACNGSSAVAGGTIPLPPNPVPGMSLVRYEPYQSASTWFGNLAQLVIGADPDDVNNRVILMQEQGNASFFKDIDWPQDAAVITFDYLFREPRGNENLTVYVDNQIVYYDNAETTLARDHLTSSGAIYVGNVAGRTARLNFVLRTDQPEGGEFGGELVIDNIRVYGFLEHDADLDGDRDLFDFAAFQRCFGHGLTPDVPLPDECWAFDVDGVDGVGVSDYAGDTADPPQFKGFAELIESADTGGPKVIPTP